MLAYLGPVELSVIERQCYCRGRGCLKFGLILGDLDNCSYHRVVHNRGRDCETERNVFIKRCPYDGAVCGEKFGGVTFCTLK